MMGGVNRFATSSVGRAIGQEALGAAGKAAFSTNTKAVGEIAFKSLAEGGVQKTMSSTVSSPMMGRFTNVGKELAGMTRDAVMEEGFRESIGKGGNNTLLPALGHITGLGSNAISNSGSLFDQVGKQDFLHKSTILPS